MADNYHRLIKLIEFVEQRTGQMLETGDPTEVRFAFSSAVANMVQVLEANGYVASISEPLFFKQPFPIQTGHEYVVDLSEMPDND